MTQGHRLKIVRTTTTTWLRPKILAGALGLWGSGQPGVRAIRAMGDGCRCRMVDPRHATAADARVRIVMPLPFSDRGLGCAPVRALVLELVKHGVFKNVAQNGPLLGPWVRVPPGRSRSQGS